MNITLGETYSNYWHSSDTVHIYHDPKFEFHDHIIITELDGCLIKNISPSKLYDTLNKYDVELNNPDFIKILKRRLEGKSLVILSNQVNSSRRIIDMIKIKMEAVAELLNIPIFAVFSTTPNKFSKPHTGMWKLLNFYYTKRERKINNAIIVSHQGGIIDRKEFKNRNAYTKVKVYDYDRAFAYNIGIPYLTPQEFMTGEKELFTWDENIIPPEVRIEYKKIVDAYDNPKIFKEMAKFNSDLMMIIVLGPPRSGKTRFSRYIIREWRNSAYGKHNEIKRLGLDNYTRTRRINQVSKFLSDRISVIIDGGCHIERQRRPFIEMAKKNNIPILYVDVNSGYEMAKVFNHACVEEAKDETTELHKELVYHEYRSTYRKPYVNGSTSRYIMISPKIENRDTVMTYRYS